MGIQRIESSCVQENICSQRSHQSHESTRTSQRSELLETEHARYEGSSKEAPQVLLEVTTPAREQCGGFHQSWSC